jgi:hypothetical protein
MSENGTVLGPPGRRATRGVVVFYKSQAYVTGHYITIAYLAEQLLAVGGRKPAPEALLGKVDDSTEIESQVIGCTYLFSD